MLTLDTVVALLTICSFVSGAFHFLIIRPLREAIYALNSSIQELRRAMNESEHDRRKMDARLAALEEAHKINKERISHLEEAWANLSRD